MKSIKLKLIICFASIVLIFVLGGLVIFAGIQSAGEQSRQFVTQHWPTANLLMESRIEIAGIAKDLLQPPTGDAAADYLQQTEMALDRLSERFKTANLKPAEIRQVAQLLQRLKEAVPKPVVLAYLPGEKMEVADATVEAVIVEIRKLRNVDLANTLWEAVMAFNDILITGDPAEHENFTTHINAIENHPDFKRLQPAYDRFKIKATEVFTAAEELIAAQENFAQHHAALSNKLQQLEEYYETRLVTPSAVALSEELNDVKIWLILTAVSSALLAMLVAYRLAAGLSRPIKTVRTALRSMGQGKLRQPLQSTRADEIGQMVEALREMGNNLCRLVDNVDGTAAELTQVTQDIQQVSGQMSAMAVSQVDSAGIATSATRMISQSSEQVLKSVDHLQLSSSESSHALASLSNHVEQIALNSVGLGDASMEVSQAIETMSDSINEIAERSNDLKLASVESIDSLARLDAATIMVDEHARTTLDIAEKVNADAKSGQQSVQSTIMGIKAIRNASNDATDIIESLAVKAQSIRNVLEVIGSLADQVDLLSLNAAIIAAQAGEHGKGFAVVAKEIKNLSAQTSLSTSEIGEVVNDVLEETERAVAAIRNTEDRIIEGEQRSHDSGAALGMIVQGAQQVTEEMQQVAETTSRQSRENQQLQATMAEISQMVTGVAAQTRAQQVSSRSVVAAAGHMQLGTAEVRSATQEQSRASRQLTKSATEIEEMIEAIRKACESQREKCLQIVAAMESLEGTSMQGRDSAAQLDLSAGKLGRQVTSLQEEMSFFDTEQN